MRLALHTDYALRVLMYLAGRSERSTIAEAAAFFSISKDHVAKVTQRLTRLGYVRSIRGIGGGLEMAKPADQISLGEVILDFEGSTNLLECTATEQIVCAIQPTCKLRGVLQEAEQVQMEYLNGVRLSDVVTPGETLVAISE